MEHHGSVVYLRLREHVEAERPALVIFGLAVPVEGAYAKLKGQEPLARRAHLLIAFLHRIVLVAAIVE